MRCDAKDCINYCFHPANVADIKSLSDFSVWLVWYSSVFIGFSNIYIHIIHYTNICHPSTPPPWET